MECLISYPLQDIRSYLGTTSNSNLLISPVVYMMLRAEADKLNILNEPDFYNH